MAPRRFLAVLLQVRRDPEGSKKIFSSPVTGPKGPKGLQEIFSSPVTGPKGPRGFQENFLAVPLQARRDPEGSKKIF